MRLAWCASSKATTSLPPRLQELCQNLNISLVMIGKEAKELLLQLSCHVSSRTVNPSIQYYKYWYGRESWNLEHKHKHKCSNVKCSVANHLQLFTLDLRQQANYRNLIFMKKDKFDILTLILMHDITSLQERLLRSFLDINTITGCLSFSNTRPAISPISHHSAESLLRLL